MKINVSVNGSDTTGDVETRTLLVHYLREHLNLTGTHVGCDTSQCGACLVHVDGALVKSCAMFAWEADGKDVLTIEGVSDDGLVPIQQAFKDHHGLQCGFCTPGMVMSAKTLLDQNPKPTEDEVRDHLEGNLCRCTGYQNIVKAVMAASGQEVADV